VRPFFARQFRLMKPTSSASDSLSPRICCDARVSCWHKADVALASTNVRCWEQRIYSGTNDKATFAFGTCRTWRDVEFESRMSSKADVHWALPFKLIFFALVDGWSLVARSLVQSYGG
jgi:hypothetical protein